MSTYMQIVDILTHLKLFGYFNLQLQIFFHFLLHNCIVMIILLKYFMGSIGKVLYSWIFALVALFIAHFCFRLSLCFIYIIINCYTVNMNLINLTHKTSDLLKCPSISYEKLLNIYGFVGWVILLYVYFIIIFFDG